MLMLMLCNAVLLQIEQQKGLIGMQGRAVAHTGRGAYKAAVTCSSRCHSWRSSSSHAGSQPLPVSSSTMTVHGGPCCCQLAGQRTVPCHAVLCFATLCFVQVAEDYRTDPQLYDKCKDSVEQLCSDVEPGSGGELDCLVSREGLVGLAQPVGSTARTAWRSLPAAAGAASADDNM